MFTRPHRQMQRIDERFTIASPETADGLAVRAEAVRRMKPGHALLGYYITERVWNARDARYETHCLGVYGRWWRRSSRLNPTAD